jgi:thioredoxin-like negative regulator of GroEL
MGATSGLLRRRVCAAAIVLIVTAMTSASAAQPIILWESDLAKASGAARAADKPMLLEFWAVDCAPCKVMDADVYSDERVVTAMDKVIPVRVDMELQKGTARKYGVAATPTIVFTDSYGNELFRYTGLLPVDPILRLLKELPGDVGRINQWSARLARDKEDFTALEALGRELRDASLYRASNQHYGRALRAPGARGRADVQADILEAMGRNHLELKEFKEAARQFERVLREFPGRASEPDVMLCLGRAQLAQNRKADARRVLQTLIDRHPDAAASAEASRLIPGG